MLIRLLICTVSHSKSYMLRSCLHLKFISTSNSRLPFNVLPFFTDADVSYVSLFLEYKHGVYLKSSVISTFRYNYLYAFYDCLCQKFKWSVRLYKTLRWKRRHMAAETRPLHSMLQIQVIQYHKRSYIEKSITRKYWYLLFVWSYLLVDTSFFLNFIYMTYMQQF